MPSINSDVKLKQHNDEYTTIKVFTLFLVVLSHCTKMYAGTGAVAYPVVDSQKWVTDYLYTFHMPLFMFASGAIYKKCIQAGKYQDMKAYVITKIKRLMVPYWLMGLFSVTPAVVLMHMTDMGFAEFYVKGILLGTEKKHLWYLLTVFIYLIAIRVVKPLLDRWEALSLVAFLLAIPLSLKFAGFGPLYYVVFFMCGYLFIAYPALAVLGRKTWYLFPVYLVVIGLNLPLISPLAGILGAFGLAYKFGPLVSEKSWYKHYAKNSMGIYLLDPMIIYAIYYVLRDKNWSPLGVSIVVFVIAMILSDFMTELVRKMKLGFIIGEG